MNGDNALERFTSSSGRNRRQQTRTTTQMHYEQLRRRHRPHNPVLPSRGDSYSVTPAPPTESLVALLREQYSPAITPDGVLFSDRRIDRSRGSEAISSSSRWSPSSSSESTISDPRSSQDHAMDGAASSRTSSPPRPSVKSRQQLARATKATAVASANSSTTTSENRAGGDSTTKRSRYLREVDRRSIIHRIDRGEKQVALAKEFGVTRAAICHINKNRVEILTRSMRVDVHAGTRHPKRGLNTASASVSAPAGSPGPRNIDCVGTPATAEPAMLSKRRPSVYEVRSQAMVLLLTTLRRRETESREFQTCTERAFRILLEEALARVLTRSIEVVTPSDFVCEGVSVVKPSCGVSISEDGFALLQVYRNIQPTSPSGFITLNATAIHEGVSSEPTLQKVCVPPDLRAYDMFLLEATCATGTGACVAIQALLDFGASEAAIHLVCLLASALAVSEICSRFPQVHLVTGAVDPEVSDDGGDTICPGLGNFTERYFNATVVHHTSLGASADL